MADGRGKRRFNWRFLLGSKAKATEQHSTSLSESELESPWKEKETSTKWSIGILRDRETEEVPGSILLMPRVSEFNEPLGMRAAPARTSTSSMPSPRSGSRGSSRRRKPRAPDKKRTADGKIILEPQPDDSLNDPLNWKVWRRDAALLSLGFYCMLGGGMTPILAAGFSEVARDYDVSVPRVALTTGLYMMGLGVGSVILSPTAILFGKRPVYLAAAVCFVLTAVWCALSPNFASLITARVFMGIAVSSVECLPSASIAEIYFLHEKAYRLGIYTLLLLGGKNLVPLVSAAIIQSLGWRWVFWIVAIVVGFGFCLLFLFVPETFWDRSPLPHRPRTRRSLSALRRSISGLQSPMSQSKRQRKTTGGEDDIAGDAVPVTRVFPARHAHFGSELDTQDLDDHDVRVTLDENEDIDSKDDVNESMQEPTSVKLHVHSTATDNDGKLGRLKEQLQSNGGASPMNVPDYFNHRDIPSSSLEAQTPSIMSPTPKASTGLEETPQGVNPYTAHHQSRSPKSFVEQLRPWSGRLTYDNWFRVAMRPFILFAYPGILWSSLVYSLSIGWLIVLSESVSSIYENRSSYNFTALQTGLVYISPFVGGILGTAVAGKCSDILVRFLSRRNGGVYEPEFRLIMGIPIAIFTTIGLMGYGWSAQERDAWIVPTLFFGFISFGCSLGSTTAITFAVDSYRQYAGEALVTLNFSKNIFHGLVFSLFFNRWLEADGSKDVFVAIGGIQLACLLTTIPMYIYGKRARMWTVRQNLMEKF